MLLKTLIIILASIVLISSISINSAFAVDPFGTSEVDLIVGQNQTVSVNSTSYRNLTIEDGGTLMVSHQGIIRVNGNYTQIGSGQILVEKNGCAGGDGGVTTAGIGGITRFYHDDPNWIPRERTFATLDDPTPADEICTSYENFQDFSGLVFDNEIESEFQMNIFGGAGSDGTDALFSGDGGLDYFAEEEFAFGVIKTLVISGGDGATGAQGVDGVMGGGSAVLILKNIISELNVDATGNNGVNGDQTEEVMGGCSIRVVDTFFNRAGIYCGNSIRNGGDASPSGSMGSEGGQGGVLLFYYESAPEGFSPLLNVTGGAGGFHGADFGSANEITDVRASSGEDGLSFSRQIFLDTVNIIRLVDTSYREITISWNEPATGETPIDYQIERKSQSEEFAIIGTSVNTTFQDTNLTADTEYTYRVSARTTEGMGDPSPEFSASTIDPIVPDPPTSLSIINFNDTSALISWVDAEFDGGSPIIEYKLQRESPLGGGFTDIIVNRLSNSTTYLDEAIEPNTEYNYQIRAVNLAGDSLPSNNVQFTTLSVPSAPHTLESSLISYRQATISWTTPSFDVRNPINGYKIERESPIGNGFEIIIGNTTSTDTAYLDNNLIAGTEYNYQVYALNSIGESLPGSISLNTTDPILANPPTSLTISNFDDTNAVLNWIGSEFDGGSPILSYSVERESPIGNGFESILNVTSTSHTDNTLTQNTEYNYRIKAITLAGASMPSNSVEITTLQNSDSGSSGSSSGSSGSTGGGGRSSSSTSETDEVEVEPGPQNNFEIVTLSNPIMLSVNILKMESIFVFWNNTDTMEISRIVVDDDDFIFKSTLLPPFDLAGGNKRFIDSTIETNLKSSEVVNYSIVLNSSICNQTITDNCVPNEPKRLPIKITFEQDGVSLTTTTYLEIELENNELFFSDITGILPFLIFGIIVIVIIYVLIPKKKKSRN